MDLYTHICVCNFTKIRGYIFHIYTHEYFFEHIFTVFLFFNGDILAGWHTLAHTLHTHNNLHSTSEQPSFKLSYYLLSLHFV